MRPTASPVPLPDSTCARPAGECVDAPAVSSPGETADPSLVRVLSGTSCTTLAADRNDLVLRTRLLTRLHVRPDAPVPVSATAA
jgi:hypothetical protein